MTFDPTKPFEVEAEAKAGASSPAFDPSKPFTVEGEASPAAFDPTKPFEVEAEPGILAKTSATIKAGASGVADVFESVVQGGIGFMKNVAQQHPDLVRGLAGASPMGAPGTSYLTPKEVQLAPKGVIEAADVILPAIAATRRDIAGAREEAEAVAPVAAKVAGFGGQVAGTIPLALSGPLALPSLVSLGGQQTVDMLPADATPEQEMLARAGGGALGIADRAIPGALTAVGLKQIFKEAVKQGGINVAQGTGQRAVAKVAGADVDVLDPKAMALETVMGTAVPLIGAGVRKLSEIPGKLSARERDASAQMVEGGGGVPPPVDGAPVAEAAPSAKTQGQDARATAEEPAWPVNDAELDAVAQAEGVRRMEAAQVDTAAREASGLGSRDKPFISEEEWIGNLAGKALDPETGAVNWSAVNDFNLERALDIPELQAEAWPELIRREKAKEMADAFSQKETGYALDDYLGREVFLPVNGAGELPSELGFLRADTAQKGKLANWGRQGVTLEDTLTALHERGFRQIENQNDLLVALEKAREGKPVYAAERPRVLAMAVDRGANLPGFDVDAPRGYVPPETLAIDPKKPLGERIREVVTSGRNGVVAFAKSKFLARGDLPQEAFFAKDAYHGRLNESAARTQWMADDLTEAMRADADKKRFAELTPAEMRPVNAALAGDKTAFASLKPEVQAAVMRARDVVDGLSSRMIEEGVVPEAMRATVEANQGVYLNRSYKLFDDPNWAKSVPEAAKRRVMSVFMSQMPDLDEAGARGLVNNLLHREDGPVAAIAKMGKREQGILTARSDIHPAVRAMWGEYEDPIVNFSKSVQRMTSLVEAAKFQREIEAMGRGKFLFDTPVGDHAAQVGGVERGVFKSLDDARARALEVDPHAEPGAAAAETGAERTKSLGGLEKYYTTPEIAATLRNLDGAVKESNAVTKALLGLSGTVQFNQTVLSPVTHVRNMVGNVAIMAANGHFNVGAASPATKALRQMASSGDKGLREAVAEYARLGLVNDSLNAGLLREVIAKSKLADKGGDGMLMKGARDVLAKTVKAYGMEDDFFKVYAFHNELAALEKAFPGADKASLKVRAAENVKNTVPTFSRAPAAVKGLRTQPFIGNFVAWPSELLRTSANTIDLALKEMATPELKAQGAKRLASFIATAVIAPVAAEQASAALLGWDKGKTDAMRELLPEFQRNTPVAWLGQNEKGEVRTMSLDGVNPYSMWHKPLKALLRHKLERAGDDITMASVADAMAESLAPWAGEKILYSKVADVGRNKDALTGRPLWNEVAGTGDKLKAAVGHVGSVFLPGAFNTGTRLYKGATGKVEDNGRTYDFSDEMRAALSGQRVTSLDVNRAVANRMREFNTRELAAGQPMRDAVRAFEKGATSATPEGFKEAWREAQEARFKEFVSMRNVVRAGLRAGAAPDKMKFAMKEGGLGMNEMGAVWNGRFIPNLPDRKDLLMLTTKPGMSDAVRSLAPEFAAWQRRGLDEGREDSGAAK